MVTIIKNNNNRQTDRLIDKHKIKKFVVAVMVVMVITTHVYNILHRIFNTKHTMHVCIGNQNSKQTNENLSLLSLYTTSKDNEKERTQKLL